MNKDRLDLKEMIRNSGLKCTPARNAILDYLVTEHRPVSIQEIIERLDEEVVNEATVYRTLDSFVEKKLVRTVEHWDRHRLYEAHVFDACSVNHAHFSCRSCGEVSCVEELGSIQIAAINLPSGYVAEEFRFQVQGVCPRCSP